ncbi:hypothetical protein IQ250_22045 [Pseudanabaenaceae cyanobacterium LEGE 13415]|nr:hypothetical protein [Pseudanabaenaceae cyanobacterium LEGE 13415]
MKVSLLASGLKLLAFQGVTTFQDSIVVATVEADLVRVAADGTLTPWINVARYGIPTGIVGLKDSIAVALSGQESGHFLLQVTQQGRVSPLADLSDLAGEFGAPFAVAVHEGHYPYYLVAVSTDVVGSKGLIARVTRSGKVTVLADLDKTAFGIGIGEDCAIATQDNGQIVKIDFNGGKSAIANLQSPFGAPLDITRLNEDWIMTTNTGWIVALKSDNTIVPLINLTEIGKGSPTTLTPFKNDVVVATQAGNLLRVVL